MWYLIDHHREVLLFSPFYLQPASNLYCSFIHHPVRDDRKGLLHFESCVWKRVHLCKKPFPKSISFTFCLYIFHCIEWRWVTFPITDGESYIRSIVSGKCRVLEAILLVNIVNHFGLGLALKRGEASADTLISESISFLSLSNVICLTAAARTCCCPIASWLCCWKHYTVPEKPETKITQCGHK